MIEPKIKAILDRFKKTVPGGHVDHNDLENVKDYVTDRLMSAGLSAAEATDLVRFIGWGSWSEGWEIGYSSGIRRGTQQFSLNGG
jgi:hypothetical protein